MDKSALRIKHLDLRKAAGPEKLKRLSLEIFTEALKRIEAVETLGIYISQAHEVDTRSLIEAAFRAGKRVCVPKIRGHAMIFVEIHSLNECRPGVLGILEPLSNEAYPGPIDLQIIPMLAYNAKGYRLGYGKGYYDQYLATYPGQKIGLCYSFNREDQLSAEIHDIACDDILTD